MWGAHGKLISCCDSATSSSFLSLKSFLKYLSQTRTLHFVRITHVLRSCLHSFTFYCTADHALCLCSSFQDHLGWNFLRSILSWINFFSSVSLHLSWFIVSQFAHLKPNQNKPNKYGQPYNSSFLNAFDSNFIIGHFKLI